MSDSLKFPEGAFIKPRQTDWKGKFMCARPDCRSMDLRWDFNPYKGQLTLSCNECGNFVTTNFALGNEVSDGRQ